MKAVQDPTTSTPHHTALSVRLDPERFSLVQSSGGRLVVSLGLDNSTDVHPQSQHSLQLLGRIAGSRDYRKGRRELRVRSSLSLKGPYSVVHHD